MRIRGFMSKKVIEAQNVHYKYPDGYRAIKNIFLYVKEGEKLGIIGGKWCWKIYNAKITYRYFKCRKWKNYYK